MKKFLIATTALMSLFSISSLADTSLTNVPVVVSKKCTVTVDLSFSGGKNKTDFSDETVTYIKKALSGRDFVINEEAFKDEQGHFQGESEFQFSLNYSDDDNVLFGQLIDVYPGEYKPFAYVYLMNGKDRVYETVRSRLKGLRARLVADLLPRCKEASPL